MEQFTVATTGTEELKRLMIERSEHSRIQLGPHGSVGEPAAWREGPYFGDFGGRFVPEALIAALDELEAEFRSAWKDPSFHAQLEALHRYYTGRPSIITEAPRFAEHAGGARILLKREDLNHTGSHKTRLAAWRRQPCTSGCSRHATTVSSAKQTVRRSRYRKAACEQRARSAPRDA